MDWQDSFGKAAELCEQGMRLLDQGRLHPAGECFREAARLAPDFAEAHFQYGQYLLESGQVEEAVDALKRSTNLDPNSADKLTILGQALCIRGRFASAIAILRQAATLAPFTAPVFVALGNACRLDGQGAAAREAFREALSIEPELVDAVLGLAHVALDEGHTPEALPHLQHALDLDPHNFRANLFMGYAHAEQGRLDVAESFFLAAIDADPEEPVPYYNLGKIYAAFRRTTEARRALLKALELAPDYIYAALALAQIDLSEGRAEAALSTLEAQLPCHDDEARLHRAIAEAADAAGRLTIMVQHLRRSLELDPEQIEAATRLITQLLSTTEGREEAKLLAGRYTATYVESFALAVAHARALASLGEKEHALDEFLRATRIEGGNADLWLTIAALAIDLGREAETAKALALLRSFHAADPIRLSQIAAYLEQNDRDHDAVKFLDAALARDPSHRRSLELAIVCNRRLGDQETALKHSEALIEKHPENPAGYFQRSLLNHERGLRIEALQDIERARSINPNEVEYRAVHAVLLEKHRQWRRAAALYIGLIEGIPESTQLYLRAANFFQRRGRFSERRRFTQALQRVVTQEGRQPTGLVAQAILWAGNPLRHGQLRALGRSLSLQGQPKEVVDGLASIHRQRLLLVGLIAVTIIGSLAASLSLLLR